MPRVRFPNRRTTKRRISRVANIGTASPSSPTPKHCASKPARDKFRMRHAWRSRPRALSPHWSGSRDSRANASPHATASFPTRRERRSEPRRSHIRCSRRAILSRPASSTSRRRPEPPRLPIAPKSTFECTHIEHNQRFGRSRRGARRRICARPSAFLEGDAAARRAIAIVSPTACAHARFALGAAERDDCCATRRSCLRGFRTHCAKRSCRTCPAHTRSRRMAQRLGRPRTSSARTVSASLLSSAPPRNSTKP